MDKKNKIKIVISVILFFLFLYANFYAIRRISRFAIEVYLYDKLLVAYQTGGTGGLNSELERVLSHDKLRHELAVAESFKKNLENIKDPEKYLTDAVNQKNRKINLLRNLRNLAFVLILIIFVLRPILNLSGKPKSRVH